MVFISWDSLRGFLVVQEDTDGFSEGQASGWTPAVDVYETTDKYVLMAELAGLARDDVRITAQERRVTLEGRRPKKGVPPQQYHRIERGQGYFARTFSFPKAIDVDRIAADCRQGVLTVSIPKMAASRIRVSVE